MASIQIPLIGDEHHLTLVHFEKLEPEMIEDVRKILTELSQKVTKYPRGNFGGILKMGKYKNVTAIAVESKWIDFFRSELIVRLGDAGIPYSDDYDFTKHISHPMVAWKLGREIPFLPRVDFISKTSHWAYTMGIGSFPGMPTRAEWIPDSNRLVREDG